MSTLSTLAFNAGGVVRVGLTTLFAPLLRGWYNHWGAASDEIHRIYPGDDLTDTPQLGYTRAVTIHTTPEHIWPWLVQIGQGRGGLYSYDGLENIAGCDIHSADHILPQHQTVTQGDLVRLGPEGYPVFSVIDFQPEKYLLLGGADPKTGQLPDFGQPVPAGASHTTWLFYLAPVDGHSTRLIVRQHNRYAADRASSILWHVVEPINFVMERRMMLGIKQRAERSTARIRPSQYS